jgi:hypothetical protein
MMPGRTKFNSHILVIMLKILSSFTPKKLNKYNAILPLTNTSNKNIDGIIDDNKYILEIMIIAFR